MNSKPNSHERRSFQWRTGNDLILAKAWILEPILDIWIDQLSFVYLPFICSIFLWLSPYIGYHNGTLHTTYPSPFPQVRDTESVYTLQAALDSVTIPSGQEGAQFQSTLGGSEPHQACPQPVWQPFTERTRRIPLHQAVEWVGGGWYLEDSPMQNNFGGQFFLRSTSQGWPRSYWVCLPVHVLPLPDPASSTSVHGCWSLMNIFVSVSVSRESSLGQQQLEKFPQAPNTKPTYLLPSVTVDFSPVTVVSCTLDYYGWSSPFVY